MIDPKEASRRALARVNRRRNRNSDYLTGMLAGGLVTTLIFTLIFVVVMRLDPVPQSRLAQEERNQKSAAEFKLFAEAVGYYFFWKNRDTRLADAAKNLGWNREQSTLAAGKIGAARQQFEAVGEFLENSRKGRPTDIQALRSAVSQLRTIFLELCREFHLGCSQQLPGEKRPSANHDLKLSSEQPGELFLISR